MSRSSPLVLQGGEPDPHPGEAGLVVGDPELPGLRQDQFVALLLRAAHGDGRLVLGQGGEHLPRDPERGHAPGDLLRRVRQGEGRYGVRLRHPA